LPMTALLLVATLILRRSLQQAVLRDA